MRTLKIIFFILLISTIGGQTVLAQLKWYNPMEETIPPIHGRFWNTEIGANYHRLPSRAEKAVRTPVWHLSKQSAGLYLKFYSNSSTITVRYKVKGSHAMPHMPATGVSGVDLYTIDCHGNKMWCAGSYSFGDTIQYKYTNIEYHNTHKEGNEFQLFLPLYNEVEWMHIGVTEGTTFSFIQPTKEKPVVVYGTSIAQGACASRPAMAWTNIVQRNTDYPFINLGFSGNGQLDENVFHLLSEIDSRLYIIDCMPNMTGEERVSLIYDRTIAGVKILREKHNTPILLVEHDGYMGYKVSSKKKKSYEEVNKELKKAYEKLISEGFTNVHYLSYEELGLTMDSQVDGVHASDLGMQQYGNAYTKKIKELFPLLTIPQTFTPCKQRREPHMYEWGERHELVLEHNSKQAPEIIMIGNSITHYWAGNPESKLRTSPESWKRLFGDKEVLNMGNGWDRIENVMWRIQHGELDGYNAKKIFMMLGTNNLDMTPDNDIVKGICEVAKMIRTAQPLAQLYIMTIYPRRDKEEKLTKINANIKNKAGVIEGVQVIDVSAGLTDKDGKIIESYFKDGLHPNDKGYNIITDNLSPYVK